MKHFFYFTLAILSCNIAFAKSVYVTDNMKFTLRSGQSSTHKITRMLSTGTRLTLLGVNKDTGYSHVKTSAGISGYIPTRFTLNKPISSWYLEKANKQVDSLKAENVKIKTTLNDLQQNNTSAVSSNNSLTQERDKLQIELKDLRRTSSRAVELKVQNLDLLERIKSAQNELQQVKRAKQALEDSTSQDWFLYGGILSFLGIFFGLLIPKISWHRKSQGNWDTF